MKSIASKNLKTKECQNQYHPQQAPSDSTYILLTSRVAQSAGIGGLDPSIAKDLIDSEDPKHKTRFEYEVRIYCQSRTNLKVVKWG